MRTQSWRPKLSNLAVIIVGLFALSPWCAMFVVVCVVVVAAAVAAVAAATAIVVVVVIVVVVAVVCLAFKTIQALPLMVSSSMS